MRVVTVPSATDAAKAGAVTVALPPPAECNNKPRSNGPGAASPPWPIALVVLTGASAKGRSPRA